MIRYAAVFIIASAIAFGQKQPDKAPQKSQTVNSIPAGATEISPNLFKHADASGKTWLYRKTPFGIVKSADVPEAAQAERTNPFGGAKATTSASTKPLVTAVEDGDTYKFERTTPFGPARWTRKKSELTADEQEIVKRMRTGTKE